MTEGCGAPQPSLFPPFDDAGRVAMTALPRFRTDLTVRMHQSNDGPVFTIKDPVSGAFFRFRQAEQFIAQQLDGKTPLEEVRQKAEKRFNATLLIDDLDSFVRRLERNGLLDTGKTARRTDRRLFRGSWLYLRFKLFDPARFFDRVARRAPFLFTPYFIAFAAAIIVLAIGTAVGSWDDYTRDLSRLYQVSTIPLLLLLTFLVVSTHEIAHGVTCTRFGGEVHEAGFMLIYFQPALYCNVSDAWFFPERSKRLWVGFAGPAFEAFIWALATLTWRVTDSETPVNHLALIVMTGAGIRTLLNFNPLIKLDGYYLLSDYLEIPNLRKRSFQYVGRLTKRLVGAGSASSSTASPRERRIYLIYGLTATIGSFAFLGYVLYAAGGLLIESGQPLLLALLTGFVGLRVRQRLYRLFSRSRSVDEDDDDEDVDESDRAVSRKDRTASRKDTTASPEDTTASPEDTAASSRKAPPKKRRGTARRWIPRLAWISLAGAAVAFLFLGRMELRISGPFNARPNENADIRAAVEGIIEEVYVHEGDQITVGQPIARLSDKFLRVELQKTEAEIRETRARLEILQEGPTMQEIEVARTSVAKAEDQNAYAQSRVTRFAPLLESGLVSRNQFEDYQEAAATSRNTLAEAQARLDALLSSVRPEQIDGVRAQIDRLEAQQRYLSEQLKLPIIVSTHTGIVATPTLELKQLLGRLVMKGDLIAKVYDFETMTVYITIPETEIADIQIGQSVVLRARAYPNIDVPGTVTSIATSAQGQSASGGQTSLGAALPGSTNGAGKTVLITTQVDNHALLLKPEMTGQAKIYCGERRIVDLVKRRLARTVKVEFWSWW